jgi:hypothetical protein
MYNEISTVLKLQKQELKESEYPELAQWYNIHMHKCPEIVEADKKLEEVIEKYNLAE